MESWCKSCRMMKISYHILLLVALVALTRSQTAEETSIQYRMTEENEPQKVIGNVAVDAGLDVKYGADVLDQLRFSFLTQSSKYSEYFSIGEQSGLLQATISIDRDTLCPHQVTCDIPLDISVQPGQYFQIIKVTVSIEDLNDNTPTFPENPVERFLSEASGPGASLPISAAEDSDSPQYNIKQYRQVSGLDVFELQVRNNSDGTVDMQLVLKQELDREENPLYQVEIVASDGDKSGTVTVEIDIKDVNDNNPTFDNQTYNTFVYENTPKYTTILKVHAVDPDAGANGEIVYGFTTRTRRAFGDIFNIDETTGEIFVVEILDYEDGDVYTLDVTAQDKSADPLPTIAKVTINVRDLNDHAPQITVNSEAVDGHVEISEDAQVGDFVAHITVIDPDSGQNGAFKCTLDDNSQFELLQLYKTEFKIVSKALFNREQKDVYNVALVCTDQGSTPQASTKRVEIRISDVNDHPPVFMPDFYNAIIAENNKIGAAIIQVNATDKDTGLNGQIRYGLAGIANELFDINPVTGNITAKVILDHEEQQSLTITVIARDQGNPQLSASATLLLNVQDTDDEAPKFSQGTYVFGVEENLPAGTSVGQISATDPDSEPYNLFTFGLDERYNTENAFRIAESTGIIYTTVMLDREIQGVYHLVVKATSSGSGQQNSTNVFVSVLDQNDNAPVIEFPNPFNNTLYVKQSDPAGFIIGFVDARDNDTEKNKQLTFNITNGNGEKFFAVDKQTGAIQVNGNLNGQEDRQFSLVIKVHDNGVPMKSAEAILNIVVNQSLAGAQDGNITSNQNLTIVIAIATVSGFLMVILIIAIVVIIRKQRRNDKRKKNKYNYMPKIVEQNGAVANGQLPSSMANGDVKPSGTPKKEVSFKTGLDHPDSMNGSFDVSIEKPNPMEYTKAEPGSSRPSFNEADLRKHGSGRYAPPSYPGQKPWSTAGQLQKPSLEVVPAADKDSDSACSADMSNTDSGRGSNDDGSDNHFRSASPHWDPNAHLKGAASPHASPMKEKPNHRGSSIATKSLQSGVHAPVHQSQQHPPHHPAAAPSHYRDMDPTYSQPHLPPRRVPSRSQSHQDSRPMYRDHVEPSWNSPVTSSSSHELMYHGNPSAYHGNHRQHPSQPPRNDRQDWKLSGNGGGYYASHV